MGSRLRKPPVRRGIRKRPRSLRHRPPGIRPKTGIWPRAGAESHSHIASAITAMDAAKEKRRIWRILVLWVVWATAVVVAGIKFAPSPPIGPADPGMRVELHQGH